MAAVSLSLPKRWKSACAVSGPKLSSMKATALERLSSEESVRFLAAEMRHTGDNASMIAFAAEVDRNHLWSNDSQRLSFNPSLQLDDMEDSSS